VITQSREGKFRRAKVERSALGATTIATGHTRPEHDQDSAGYHLFKLAVLTQVAAAARHTPTGNAGPRPREAQLVRSGPSAMIVPTWANFVPSWTYKRSKNRRDGRI
jgi:hypothetical protein